MRIRRTRIPGCLDIELKVFRDHRGSFVKHFHAAELSQAGIGTAFAEEYHTYSHRGVLRGMHFQIPPMEYAKIVCCISGEVLDAVVDLRVGSPMYGKCELFPLNGGNPRLIYLPPGLAHGFYVTGDHALMLYQVTRPYSPVHDTGIVWNSAEIPWPSMDPILSERDRSFPPLSGFASPFLYHGGKADA